MSRTDITLGDEIEANRPCRVDLLVKEGDEWDLYRVTHAGRPGLLKISSSEDGDDRVLNEAFALTNVRSNVKGGEAQHLGERFLPYFPTLYDVFDIGGRQCVVTEWVEGCVTLQQVIEAYLDGIDVKDMAWMMRRILVALGATHRAEYIHGAVVPTNILIHPEMHGLILTNWSYAVPSDGTTAKEPITVDPAWQAWYPDSPKLGVPPHRGIDTFLAARTMVALCGGDPVSLTIPDAPREFRAFFQACAGPIVPDAWELKIRFDNMIEMLWGPKRFRPFKMPGAADAD